MSPSDLVADLMAKGSIDADDVLKLRREVYADGIIDPEEVKAVFELERACESQEAEWIAFFVDELTYYLVAKAEPRGYVSDENARFLIEEVLRDGKIKGPTELELLITIVESARRCPEELVLFVLEAVKESVLRPGAALYGTDREAGVIDPVDVEIIRRAIYGGGGAGTYTVTRREADLLWDLNKATVDAENAEGWRELFVQGVASHLMFPLGPPEVPEVEEVLARQEWLGQRPTYGRFLLSLRRSAGDLASGGIGEAYSQVWSEVDLFGTRRKRQEAEREEERLREEMARETIDESEAEWLIARVSEDDVLGDNLLSLLAFIRKESDH
jgi:hypothetical protein